MKPSREERHLRLVVGRAIGAALLVAQASVPFVACDSSPSATGAASSASSGVGGAASTSGGAGGAGGSGGGDAGPARDCKSYAYAPDAAHPCGEYIYFPCGAPDASTFSQCYFDYNACETLCGNPAFNCHAAPGQCDEKGEFLPDPDGGVSIECAVCLGAGGSVGRRPAGLRLGACGHDVGGHLARAAAMEAASVVAFRRLARELAALGAPRALVEDAEEAARDEAAHARATAGLAARRGAGPLRRSVARVGQRDLEAIAIENAVEGCIQETLGAALNAWQAAHASDPEVARLYASIADDELRHAALSWRVARFCAPRLTPAGRTRVADAARAAIAEVSAPSRGPGDAALGLPTPAARAAIVRELSASAWRGFSRRRRGSSGETPASP